MPINWSKGDDSVTPDNTLSDYFALSATPGYRQDSNIKLYAKTELASFRSRFD